MIKDTPQGDLAGGRSEATHLLSFDVEEYFHVEAAAARVAPRQWGSFQTRLREPLERILQALADHQTRATFFVLGWVAQRQGPLIRRLSQLGHEIASHGQSHQMITRQSPAQFRQDLLDSRHLLQDLTGQPVIGYRAPTFSVMHRTAWALDVLAGAGFRYDSSIFPVRHDRYGVADAPTGPHRAVGPEQGSILEIPPLTRRLAGTNWPLGGGGYLRLLPIKVIASALNHAARLGTAGMIYLHPWELDPGQPLLPMGKLARWRHRVNLHTTQQKLAYLLGKFRFSDVRSQLASLDVPDLVSHRYGLTESPVAGRRG